jgi:shikimate 5-dehydrogenase/shikimate kinase
LGDNGEGEVIYLIIGHRGTGKSSFLARVSRYYQDINRVIKLFDLDQVIEESEQKNISNIFEKDGESHFRSLEHKYLRALVKEHHNSHQDVFISLGGGATIPVEVRKQVKIWWIQRDSDQTGRVFLDRPRLNKEISPLEEFKKRYIEREERFNDYCDRVINISEGFSFPNRAEALQVLGDVQNLAGDFTLFPKHLNDSFITLRKSWGVRFFEIRDDLLSDNEIEEILPQLEKDQVIVSLRKENTSELVKRVLKEGYRWDFPLELNKIKELGKPTIVSLHERDGEESFTESIKRLEEWDNGNTILKFAPMVESFEELWEGHQWATQDLKHRSFLPRSQDGRWSWYRLLMSRKFPINFYREGRGSSIDQPHLTDWIRFQECDDKYFAAILGFPVWHSFTPSEQYQYFSSTRIPVLRINIAKKDWISAIEVIKKLGLRYAAITSPLKVDAYESCTVKSEQADIFQSVNTIYVMKNGEIVGHNTDLDGLNVIFENLGEGKDAVVWGGGGTLPLIKMALPKAHYYSARTGKARETSFAHDDPKTVVWAVGKIDGLRMPPSNWRPERIIDLNYFDHSPGIDYAANSGAQYFSGVEMFKAQALEQRKFWKKYES